MKWINHFNIKFLNKYKIYKILFFKLNHILKIIHQKNKVEMMIYYNYQLNINWIKWTVLKYQVNLITLHKMVIIRKIIKVCKIVVLYWIKMIIKYLMWEWI
jgi:hypothetical protein